MSRRSAAARCAVVSGVAGAVAGVALGAFFGLARPFGPTPNPDAMWLGPLNDAASVVQFAALVPVARAVRRRLAAAPEAGRPVLVVTDVATAAMAVFVGLQVLLVAGALPFAVQGPLATVAALVCLGWTVHASRVGARTGLLSRPVVAVGTAAGLLFLAGVATGGLGLLLADGPRQVVLAAALALATAGWAAMVPWTYLLGDDAALATPVPVTGGEAGR
ncbi:hypothetical protein ACVGOW_18765 [Pseudonocardia saturnea]